MCRGRRVSAAQVNEITIDDDSEVNNWVTSTENDEQQYNEDLFVRTVANNDRRNGNLWHKDIQICGQKICFKLDMVSEANLIPKNIFSKSTRNTVEASIMSPGNIHR